MPKASPLKELRVLQILPALNSGGVERGTLEISEALVKAGYPSFVASSGGALVPALERAGGHSLLVSTLKNHFLLFYSIQRLKSLIHQHRITLVHARSRAPAWAAYYAAKACHVPFITTFHGAYSIQNRLKKAYNTIMTKGDKVIAPSQFIYDHLLENYAVDPAKIELIYRGVDLEVFDSEKVSQKNIEKHHTAWGVQSGERVFIFPGRLTPIKGHERVIKGLQKHKNKPFKLIILGSWAGKEAYYERLNHLIDTCGLQEKVLIQPSSAHVEEVYASADCVLCPSTKPESFGRTSAEAGAMGKPVLATAIGGGKEIVLPGETGYLVAPQGQSEMDKVLEKLLMASDEELKRMGSNAKKHVCSTFPLSKMQDKTLEVYRSVAGL